MAIFSLATGRISEAEKYLKQLVEVTKTHASEFTLADYYIATRRTSEAVTILTPIAAAPRSTPEARRRLARAYAGAGNIAKAQALSRADSRRDSARSANSTPEGRVAALGEPARRGSVRREGRRQGGSQVRGRAVHAGPRLRGAWRHRRRTGRLQGSTPGQPGGGCGTDRAVLVAVVGRCGLGFSQSRRSCRAASARPTRCQAGVDTEPDRGTARSIARNASSNPCWPSVRTWRRCTSRTGCSPQAATTSRRHARDSNGP